MGYKVTHEADDHFVVEDGSGKPFKVAKKGLGKGVLGKIQGFAEGGRVQSEPQHQRDRTRARGRYAAMPPCEHCGKKGSLEPAFGFEDVPGAKESPYHQKYLCGKCAGKAWDSVGGQKLADGGLVEPLPPEMLEVPQTASAPVPAQAPVPTMATPPEVPTLAPMESGSLTDLRKDVVQMPSGQPVPMEHPDVPQADTVAKLRKDVVTMPGGPVQLPKYNKETGQYENVDPSLVHATNPAQKAPRPAFAKTATEVAMSQPQVAPAGPSQTVRQTAQASASAAQTQGPKGSQGPRLGGDFEEGVKQQKEALTEQAKLEGQLAKMRQDAAGEREALIKAHAEQTEKFLADYNTNREKMRQDVLDSKIDPNRFWNSKSTGQKVSASIGMILGGLGSGLTGGPNVAAQLIEKAIDRDMDSQKTNLANKQWSIMDYSGQVKDELSQRLMMKSDKLEAAAAILEKNAATLGGEQAQVNAKKASGQLLMASEQARQEFAQRQSQIALAQGQARLQERQIAMQEFQFKMMMQAMNGGGDSWLNSPYAPKELKETAVRLPNGKIEHAPTAADAEKAKEFLGPYYEFQDSLAKVRNLQKQYAGDVKSGKLIPDADKAEAQLAHTQLLQALSKLKGTSLAGLGNQELEQFRQMTPDNSDFWTTDNIVNRKLDALQGIAQSSLGSMMRTRFGVRPITPLQVKTAMQAGQQE